MIGQYDFHRIYYLDVICMHIFIILVDRSFAFEDIISEYEGVPRSRSYDH